VQPVILPGRAKLDDQPTCVARRPALEAPSRSILYHRHIL